MAKNVLNKKVLSAGTPTASTAAAALQFLQVKK